MQIAKANRDALLKPLQAAAGVVDKHPTLPILANVLVHKSGERVSFTASNIETEVQSYADTGVGADLVAIAAPARKLANILRVLPDDEVDISIVGKRLAVQSGTSRFFLQTLGADQFPEIPRADAVADFVLPAATLKHLLSMVHYAAAKKDVRYYLNGVLLDVDNTATRAVATDGHRLAMFEDGPATGSQASAIIPNRSVQELVRLLPDTDDDVRVQMAANQVRFEFGTIALTSKTIDGRYPDYKNVIPAKNKRVFQIDRETMAAALRRVSILANEKLKGVRLALDVGVLRVSSTNADQEEAQEEVEIEYAGEPLDVGFNVTYLLDVLDSLRCTRVEFALGGETDGALITGPSIDGFRYVVMPMRA